jgi:hypothetical protein
MTRTTKHRNAMAVVAAGLSLAALTGCGTNSTAAPPTSSAAQLTPPTNPPTPAQIAEQQVTPVVQNFTQVVSSVFANPTQNLAVIDTVATGDAAASMRNQARQTLDNKLVLKGESRVVSVHLSDYQPNARPVTATTRVCQDVSGSTITRPDGKSDVDPQRLDKNLAILTLTNVTPNDPAGWRVSKADYNSRRPCDAT